MNNLVDSEGSVQYGLYDTPVENINYEDYRLETPMGIPVPAVLKRLLINQFVFFGIVGPEFMLGMAVADLRFLANGFFYIYDRKTGSLTETKKIILSRASLVKPCPERISARFISDDLHIEMKSSKISAKGRDIALDATLNFADTNPLRLCTRAGYRGWIYTRKTMPVSLSGHIIIGDRRTDISSPACMGLLDWTIGYMRRHTFWNWASTALTLPDGRTLGLNLSCGVNETGFTENAFWLNGKMTKVDTVSFVFDRHDLYKKWRITSYDRKTDLVFSPECHRSEKVNAVLLASIFTQLMGTFDGKLTASDGEVIDIRECPGWAEDHYAKW
ncbi:DUF2804 domain-containing protein [Desulfococcaceae bacterium HSG8]|nr:DUF2804 domain-containing protein [Desulfococcaceae bacterium HSG8]